MHNFLAVPHAAGMWYHTPAAHGTERENVEFLLQNPFLATKPDPTRPNEVFLGQNHLGNETNSFHTSIFIHFLSFPPLFSHLSTPSPSPSSIFLHLPLFCTFLPSFIHGYSSLVGAWWSLLHQHGQLDSPQLRGDSTKARSMEASQGVLHPFYLVLYIFMNSLGLDVYGICIGFGLWL